MVVICLKNAMVRDLGGKFFLQRTIAMGEYKRRNGLEWNGLLEWLERSKFPVVLATRSI